VSLSLALRTDPEKLVAVPRQAEPVLCRDFLLQHLEGFELELDHHSALTAHQVIVVFSCCSNLIELPLSRRNGGLYDACLYQ
jgi:hypothetical protein